MLELILGGARSGKSRYAEHKAQAYNRVVYVATAQIGDDEMAHRVALHRERREPSWTTLEKYKDFCEIDFQNADAILIDCLTLMVTGLFFEEDCSTYDDEEFLKLEEKIWHQIARLLDMTNHKPVFLVSNEIGLGLVPEDRISRIFRDMMGRFHQKIAQRADHVFFIVAGLPLVVK